MASNFYKDLVEHDFYEEKTASEKSNTASMLESFSADQIEALAEELGLLIEKSAEETVEGKTESKVETQEDKKEHEDKKDATSQTKAEGEPKSDEREVTQSEGAEESKTKQEKEEIIQPKAKENEEKAASYSEDDIIKVAYEVAEDKLASAGVTLADYVFSKVANEEIALFIADKAEKLAYVSELSPLLVADDILGEVANLIGGNEE